MDHSIESLTAALHFGRAQGNLYRVNQTSAEIRSHCSDSLPPTIHNPFELRVFPFYEVSACMAIGNRMYQEDRFTVCTEVVKGYADSGFFAVFDGTVGDFASDTVKDLVIPHLLTSLPWPRIVELLDADQYHRMDKETTRPDSDNEEILTINKNGKDSSQQQSTLSFDDKSDMLNNVVSQLPNCHKSPESSAILPLLICQAMEWMYLNVDSELLNLCSMRKKDYASSTAVTVLILGGYICVGHLGDSRVAIGYKTHGLVYGEFLTEDHKPNNSYEHERILRCGGTVEYLHNHNNKPFLRGGDFTIRKSLGGLPMQLQYSRAFGGKDLKAYGLSSEPDLKVFKVHPTHHVLILASDGIWDVHTADNSVRIVVDAKERGEDPANALVQSTLTLQSNRQQSADNLTVVIVFLNGEKYFARFNDKIHNLDKK